MNAQAQRFTLDEARAQEWLQRVAAKYDYEYGDAPEPEADATDEEMPAIGSEWDPVMGADQENEVFSLVRRAVDKGFIGKPEDNDLDFEYVDDEDGGYYFFVIRVAGGRLKLASHAEEMRRLGERDATGITAALAILREAVQSANGTLSALDEYVAARNAASPVAS